MKQYEQEVYNNIENNDDNYNNDNDNYNNDDDNYYFVLFRHAPYAGDALRAHAVGNDVCTLRQMKNSRTQLMSLMKNLFE